MKYKTLKNGFSLPVLGLGTLGIGGFLEADYTHDKEEVFAIKEAIKLGYTHIDTAELYGAGHAEELVGEAIKDFKRSELILTSKVFRTHLQYADVITSCKASLARLKTDYLDLYLIHAPNEKVPLSETIEAMDKLVDMGLVKYIGVSNFTTNQINEARKYAKHPLVVDQIPYSLASKKHDLKSGFKQAQEKVVPFCHKHDMLVVAYRPIERGLLLKHHPVLDKLTRKYQKTKAQIVLNWVISQKNVVAISKSVDIKHLKENLGVVGWKLDQEDINLLNQTDFTNLVD